MKNNPFESQLERLARTLTDQFGVRVTCQGEEAWTDGRQIVLPSLPEPLDDNLVCQVTIRVTVMKYLPAVLLLPLLLLSPEVCTAQYDEAAHHGIDALLNLGLGEKLRDFGDRLCAAELERRSESELRLRALRGRLLELRATLGEPPAWWRRLLGLGRGPEHALALSLIGEIAELEQRTLPELFIAYNPWPDHFAHFEGPFADEILSPSGELNRLERMEEAGASIIQYALPDGSEAVYSAVVHSHKPGQFRPAAPLRGLIPSATYEALDRFEKVRLTASGYELMVQGIPGDEDGRSGHSRTLHIKQVD